MKITLGIMAFVVLLWVAATASIHDWLGFACMSGLFLLLLFLLMREVHRGQEKES